MLEFVAGIAVGIGTAGAVAIYLVQFLRLEQMRAKRDTDAARQSEQQAHERVFRLLAANQSEAIRRAVGSDPTEEVLRREEEDRRFKASFQSSD